MAKPTNMTGGLFYSERHCICYSINFHVIESHLGPIHLCFSDDKHRQAVRALENLVPGIKKIAAKEVGDPYCDMLFRKVITGRVELPDFDKNPFLRAATEFQRRVWRKICGIKPGQTITYGELASAAGSPQGARAAGLACNRNPLALIIPCHRIVAANGPGGFAVDLMIKQNLLRLENREKTKMAQA